MSQMGQLRPSSRAFVVVSYNLTHLPTEYKHSRVVDILLLVANS